MVNLIKAGSLIVLTIALSGCIGTITAISTGLTAASLAGCEAAAANPSANVVVVNNLCGSAFK
jgi:hypothetical protein